MIKFIGTMIRKDGTTHEDFSRYWYEKHGKMAYKVPDVRRYVQNHAIRLPGGGEPPFDGVGEMWFDDVDSWRKAADFHLGSYGKEVREDEDKFIYRDKATLIVAEEKIYVPFRDQQAQSKRAGNMVKLIAFMKRKNDITHDDFLRYWYEKHGQMAYMVPNLRQYVQNHAMTLPGGGEPKFDGVGEYWFDSIESWREAADFYQGSKGKIIREDEENFVDRSKVILLIAEERVYIS